MEIKYTNFALDPNLYGKNEINAVIDLFGTYIYDTIYDIKTLQPSSKMPVFLFLNIGANAKKRKLVSSMLNEMEISKELQKRTLKTLSSGELSKVLIIKACILPVKNIILESLDACFNYKELQNILKTIKSHSNEIDKTVIVTANRIETLIQYVDRYIVTDEDKIVYKGADFTEIKAPTDIREFTELANAKGAKLEYYKEPNDLLKAIYRSVK